MFDTYIFDLDGTLSDNSDGIFAGIRYALERLGKPVPEPAELRRFIGPPLRMTFLRRCHLTEEEKQNMTRVTGALIKRILGYLKPYWLQFALVFITILLSEVSQKKNAHVTAHPFSDLN